KEIEQAKQQLSTKARLSKKEVQYLKTLISNTSLNLKEIKAESEIFKVQQEALFAVHQKVTDLLFQQSEDEEYKAEKENANNYKKEIARIDLMVKKVRVKNNLDKEVKGTSPFGGGKNDKAVEDLKERFSREKKLIKVYLRDLYKLVIENAKDPSKKSLYNGSQKIAKELVLCHMGEEEIIHHTFGGQYSNPVQHSRYKLYLANIARFYRCNFDVSGIPKIDDVINSPPSGPWIEECNRQGIKLTDLNNGSSGIKVLIGADVARKLFKRKEQVLRLGPIAMETHLRWLLMGKRPLQSENTSL
ncbi:hypothetical protein ILUMI_19625, partial [Ignelater luminosus]